MGINGDNIRLLASTLLANAIDPPRAHSNNSATPSPSASNHANNNGSLFSSVKQETPTKSEPSPATNGYTNGFMSGPVDLTRKSSTPSISLNQNHSNFGGDANNNSPLKNRSSPSTKQKSPRIAHEASQHRSSSSAVSSLVGNLNSLFSLPAPPPPNVPVSPNNRTTTMNSHRRSTSSLRNSGTSLGIHESSG